MKISGTKEECDGVMLVIKIHNVKSALLTECSCIEVFRTAACISLCGVCCCI